MKRLRFYFEHSLLYYFLKRAREKWFKQEWALPKVGNFHDIVVCLEGLPLKMRELIDSEVYEKSEITLLSKHLKGTENILELGAAIGLVGLYCKKIKHITNMVSVEPNPVTLKRLHHNYALNGLDPVILEAAINETDAPLRMYVSDMFWSDSVILNSDHTEKRSIVVNGMSLPSVLQKVDFSVDTLIINVEGAEQCVLVRDIPLNVELIFIELHPDILGAKKAFALLEAMIRIGFSIEDQLGDAWVLRRKRPA